MQLGEYWFRYNAGTTRSSWHPALLPRSPASAPAGSRAPPAPAFRTLSLALGELPVGAELQRVLLPCTQALISQQRLWEIQLGAAGEPRACPRLHRRRVGPPGPDAGDSALASAQSRSCGRAHETSAQWVPLDPIAADLREAEVNILTPLGIGGRGRASEASSSASRALFRGSWSRRHRGQRWQVGTTTASHRACSRA